MQSNKESFWEQVRIAFGLIIFGTLFFIKWLLLNRTKWLIDQLPHRAKKRKKRDQEIKALEEKLGLKKRDKNAIYYDPYYYKHYSCVEYERYEDDSFWGSNTYAAKRQRYLEELRFKVAEGWKDSDIVVVVHRMLRADFSGSTTLPSIYYIVRIAVRKNSPYDCGQEKLGLLKYYSGQRLDECGNPMDYKVIWESEEIWGKEIRGIASLRKRIEVVEFLKELQKVNKEKGL